MMITAIHLDTDRDAALSSIGSASMLQAWIGRELKALHGRILAEPVPDSLLSLLAEFPAAPG